MRIKSNIISVKPLKSVISVGSFDGVHLAHQKIIEFMNLMKYKKNLNSVIYTFDNHPSTVFSEKTVKLLTTNNERKYLFEKENIDDLIFQRFDKEFASFSAEYFIRNVLIKHLNLKVLIVGDDHRFGKSREGSFEHLNILAKKYDFEVFKIDSVFVNNTRVSSTNIRNAITNGNIQEANKLLGYEYFINSRITAGEKIGRKIGFPTANLTICENKLLPKIGVYATKVIVNNKEFLGMCNVGRKPTFNKSNDISVEVNIFDFKQDIYNQKVKLKFFKKIRDEMFFSDKHDLIKQLYKDKQIVLAGFGKFEELREVTK